MSRMSIRWHGRDALIDESEFEALVRAGLVPDDAWIISPTYTKSHAIQAGDLEVFHLWRPEPTPPPVERPSVLGEIYLRRPVSVATLLLAANLVVSFVLLIAWRGAYPYALAQWALELKLETRGYLDVLHLLMPTFVHATPGHLFGNMLYLFAFGAIVEYAFGAWRTLAIYFTAGLGGSMLSYALLDSPRMSVGASGAIFGLIGATFVYLVRHHRTFGDRLRWRARRIFIPMVLAVIAYSIAGGNLWAHGGGLIVGAIVAAVLDLTRGRPLSDTA
jgi:membrane associated rhomboid family serine protease